MALYSAFVLDLSTKICFLLFQVIKFPLRKVQYIVVDFLANSDPMQLALVKAYTCRLGCIDIDTGASTIRVREYNISGKTRVQHVWSTTIN